VGGGTGDIRDGCGSSIVLFLPRPSNRVRNCLCKVRSSNYRRVQSTRRSRFFLYFLVTKFIYLVQRELIEKKLQCEGDISLSFSYQSV
jgi:hypothetical protein